MTINQTKPEYIGGIISRTINKDELVADSLNMSQKNRMRSIVKASRRIEGIEVLGAVGRIEKIKQFFSKVFRSQKYAIEESRLQGLKSKLESVKTIGKQKAGEASEFFKRVRASREEIHKTEIIGREAAEHDQLDGEDIDMSSEQNGDEKSK